jgi:hypothetical protein
MLGNGTGAGGHWADTGRTLGGHWAEPETIDDRSNARFGLRFADVVAIASDRQPTMKARRRRNGQYECVYTYTYLSATTTATATTRTRQH